MFIAYLESKLKRKRKLRDELESLDPEKDEERIKAIKEIISSFKKPKWTKKLEEKISAVGGVVIWIAVVCIFAMSILLFLKSKHIGPPFGF
jgi:hypothetical protein